MVTRAEQAFTLTYSLFTGASEGNINVPTSQMRKLRPTETQLLHETTQLTGGTASPET